MKKIFYLLFPGIVFVAYEFCAMGSLESFLRSKRVNYVQIGTDSSYTEETCATFESRYANLIPYENLILSCRYNFLLVSLNSCFKNEEA